MNKEGVPDKGNPFVIATMTGKKPRVGRSELEKKLDSIFGHGEDSVKKAKEIFDNLPDGTVVAIRRPGNESSEIIIYTKHGHYYYDDSEKEFYCYNPEKEIEFGSRDYEFDIILPDEGDESSGQESFSNGCMKFQDHAFKTKNAYVGSGKKQIDFFAKNSNADSIISNLSDDQIEAFKSATSGYFMHGQQYQGWDNMEPLDQEYTRCIDEALDQATLDKGCVVSRLSNACLVCGKGWKNPLISELRAMKGKKVISKGIMSCAAADQGLYIGDESKMVEYKITIPGGSKGAGMWIGDSRVNPWWGPKQREFLMNRDVEYEVGDTTYDASRRIFVVELKFSRRLKHDYGSGTK